MKRHDTKDVEQLLELMLLCISIDQHVYEIMNGRNEPCGASTQAIFVATITAQSSKV